MLVLQRAAAWDELMGSNTFVLAAYTCMDTQRCQEQLKAKMRKHQGSGWQLCKWVAVCLPGEETISRSLLAQATGRSRGEANAILKWQPALLRFLNPKHDFAVWAADGKNDILYERVSWSQLHQVQAKVSRVYASVALLNQTCVCE